MAGSLQDQFLAAGLIKKQKAKNIQTAKKKAQKQSRANKTELLDEAAELAKKAQEEQRLKSQALNEKRKKEANKKAALAQIRQIVEQNIIYKAPKNMPESELLAYNFTDENKIKTIYLAPKNHELISQGKIAVVKLLDAGNDIYHLTSVDIANKIKDRNPKAIVLLNVLSEEEQPSENDPYAGFEVPDDLMW